jgi:type I restriction enzyme M protein
MHWIVPSEKDTDNAALEKRLWDAADQFRANSGLKSQEYSAPVLGLIFLKYISDTFEEHRAKLLAGQGGGEFYTQCSIVRLLTEVIEPYHGRILNPACGY